MKLTFPSRKAAEIAAEQGTTFQGKQLVLTWFTAQLAAAHQRQQEQQQQQAQQQAQQQQQQPKLEVDEEPSAIAAERSLSQSLEEKDMEDENWVRRM